MILFLEAPFELVTKLRNERKSNEGITNDIHEKDLDFMKKVYDNAIFVADYLKWDKIDCSDGSNFKSIEDIHNEIIKKIEYIDNK